MKTTFIFLLTTLISACSSLKTNYDYDPKVNFTEYKSFAWVAPKTNIQDSYHLNGLTDQRVKEAVNNELESKGVTLTDTAKAELLVNYLTKVEKKVNVEHFNTRFGYYPFYGGHIGDPIASQQTIVNEYEVGTLIIDLVDQKTGHLVWRGTAAKILEESNTPQQRIEKINIAVMTILENYPPKTVK